MEMNIGIWHDAEVLNGRGTRTEVQHEPVYMQGPVNARECPCDGEVYYDEEGNQKRTKCENYSACSSGITECSAFRNWSSRGDYKDTDVMRFVRAIKIED